MKLDLLVLLRQIGLRIAGKTIRIVVACQSVLCCRAASIDNIKAPKVIVACVNSWGVASFICQMPVACVAVPIAIQLVGMSSAVQNWHNMC